MAGHRYSGPSPETHRPLLRTGPANEWVLSHPPCLLCHPRCYPSASRNQSRWYPISCFHPGPEWDFEACRSPTSFSLLHQKKMRFPLAPPVRCPKRWQRTSAAAQISQMMRHVFLHFSSCSFPPVKKNGNHTDSITYPRFRRFPKFYLVSFV